MAYAMLLDCILYLHVHFFSFNLVNFICASLSFVQVNSDGLTAACNSTAYTAVVQCLHLLFASTHCAARMPPAQCATAATAHNSRSPPSHNFCTAQESVRCKQASVIGMEHSTNDNRVARRSS